MSNRAEAIDILTRMSTNHFYGHREQEAFKLGAEALSAERRGRWTTERTMEHDGEWYCSVCGYEPTVYEASNYCPNCGARMEASE